MDVQKLHQCLYFSQWERLLQVYVCLLFLTDEVLHLNSTVLGKIADYRSEDFAVRVCSGIMFAVKLFDCFTYFHACHYGHVYVKHK